MVLDREEPSKHKAPHSFNSITATTNQKKKRRKESYKRHNTKER